MISAAKSKLRIQVKTEISKLCNETIQLQSNSITDKLIGLEEFQRCKNIALYMAMDKEVQTTEMIEYCFKLGKKVYLPRCTYEQKGIRKANHLDMLRVRSFADAKSLKPRGKFRLKEPVQGEDALDEGLDIIIVPGVGFDKQRRRLGHGAGFYDEFFSVYYNKFGKLPYLIGVGFQEQMVKDIPVEEHDWDLDCIITPNQVVLETRHESLNK